MCHRPGEATWGQTAHFKSSSVTNQLQTKPSSCTHTTEYNKNKNNQTKSSQKYQEIKNKHSTTWRLIESICSLNANNTGNSSVYPSSFSQSCCIRIISKCHLNGMCRRSLFEPCCCLCCGHQAALRSRVKMQLLSLQAIVYLSVHVHVPNWISFLQTYQLSLTYPEREIVQCWIRKGGYGRTPITNERICRVWYHHWLETNIDEFWQWGWHRGEATTS